MTNQEASRILDGLKPNMAIGQGNKSAYDIGQALCMAINALTALEKIRDEIDEQIKLYNKESDDFGIVYGLKFAQTIISNYTKGDTNE